MDFNLNTLQKAVNEKFVKPLHTPVQFHLTDSGYILAKFGEVAYFFNYEKLKDVLAVNNFDHYYKEDTQYQVNELLSKHIINQLRASLGLKSTQRSKQHKVI